MNQLRLEDLKVRPGESVAAAMRRFELWARSQHLVKADARLRFTVSHGLGTWVTVNVPSQSFVGAFPVSQVGPDSVSVGFGTLNNVVPKIGKMRIDGLTEDGEQGDIPVLQLEPLDVGNSYVGLSVQVDVLTGKIEADDKDQLKISVVHKLELDEGFFDGGSPDNNGEGFCPVAQIYWRDSTIQRVRQIVYQNKEHRWVKPFRGVRGRHFFPSV